MPQPKAARWLDLLAFLLQHRFPVAREEIFEAVVDYREALEGADTAGREAVRRKFERDKDELRELGVKIETVELKDAAGSEADKGYRLQERDFYLPYLEFRSPRAAGRADSSSEPYQSLLRIALTDSDVALLGRATARVAALKDTPLGDAAASARRKLAFDVPLPLASVERLLAQPLEGEASKALEVLQHSVADHAAVKCSYYAIGRDAETERVIEPYGLFFHWGHWYCVARCRLREAMRVFRVDRMRAAKALTGPDGRFEVPEGFSVREYVRRAPWELSELPPEEVVVRFHFPESRWVLAQGVGDPVDPLLDDGGAVISFSVRERGSFLRWLLTFRAGIEVRKPAEYGRQLAALRSRVASLYAKASA
jgi:predicted DNA-binding transcriptional regulator YafY